MVASGLTRALWLTRPRGLVVPILRRAQTLSSAEIEAAIADGCTLVYLESPTNPTLKILDIRRLAGAAHAAGAIVSVDNTFATPINQRPLALGAVTRLLVHRGRARDQRRNRRIWFTETPSATPRNASSACMRGFGGVSRCRAVTRTASARCARRSSSA